MFGSLGETLLMTSEPASRHGTAAEIWVICGNACAGATTTARRLAQWLPLAAHVDGPTGWLIRNLRPPGSFNQILNISRCVHQFE